jgi:hypothetical protein
MTLTHPGHGREFLRTNVGVSEATADALTKYTLTCVHLVREFNREARDKQMATLCADRAHYLASPEDTAKYLEDSSKEGVEFNQRVIDGFVALLTEEEEILVFAWTDTHMRTRLLELPNIGDVVLSGELTTAEVIARACPQQESNQ